MANKNSVLKLTTVASIVIALLLAIPVSAFAEGDSSPRVLSTQAGTKYAYSVTPIIAPINSYIYVKTNNPDPYSFRIVDKSSKYFDPSSTKEQGVYIVKDTLFLDVLYERESTFRVKGGYIFYNAWESDGGNLVVQEKNGGSWKDVATIKCQALQDSIDYVIDAYASSVTGFFNKMDAVQRGLLSINVYPKSLLDSSRSLSDYKYPYLTHPGHFDQYWLYEGYRIYETSEKHLFASWVYPFVMDSLDTPSFLSAVAKRLDSKTVSKWSDFSHAHVGVTSDGTTKYYGGQGRGSTNPLYAKHVIQYFKFNNSSNDYGLKGTLGKIYDALISYGEEGDKEVETLKDLIAGATFTKTIGKGCWIKTTNAYAYVPYGPGNSARARGDVWVDGRYIDSNLYFRKGETFDKHPTASIILHDVVYTDIKGNTHTNDVLYTYSSEYDRWHAPFYYTDQNDYSTSILATLPQELILTREQVIKMKVDQNTNLLPEKGRYYNGLYSPGTPFSNKWTRLSGANQMRTMQAIVQEGWKTTGGTVVIANMGGYRDALSVSGIAGLEGAPLILTSGTNLSPQTKEELLRLKPSKVIVAGGEGAINEKVFGAIKSVSGANNVVRIWGETAPKTASELNNTYAGKWSSEGIALLAHSNGWRDSASAASIAYTKHYPVYLAEKNGKVSANTVASMKRCGVKEIVILGGTLVIPNQTVKDLIKQGFTVKTRLGGKDAVETSRKVANWGISKGMKANNMAVISFGSSRFREAFAGAALCGKNGSLMVMSYNAQAANTEIPTQYKTYIKQGYILGDTSALSDDVYNTFVAATR